MIIVSCIVITTTKMEKLDYIKSYKKYNILLMDVLHLSVHLNILLRKNKSKTLLIPL